MRYIRVIGVVLACVLVACLAINKTIAFFTDTENVTSKFIFGDIDIVPVSGSFTDIGSKVPNQEVYNSVKVANNSDSEAIVFVEVKVPVATFTLVNNTEKSEVTEEVFWVKTSDITSDSLQTKFNEQDWVLLSSTKASDYVTYLFGYNKALGMSSVKLEDTTDITGLDALTPALFDKIQFKNYLEGTLSNNYDILVNYYGVQARYLVSDSGESLTGSLYNEDGSLKADASLTKDTLSKIFDIIH